jgi:hypothetical protein
LIDLLSQRRDRQFIIVRRTASAIVPRVSGSQETHVSIRIAGHRVLMIVIVTIDCSAALATSQGGTDQTKAHTPPK